MSARVNHLVTLSVDVQTLVHQHRTEMLINGRRVVYEESGLLDLLKAKMAETGAGEESGNASGRPVTARMPAAQEAAFSLLVEVDTKTTQITKWLGASGTSRSTADNLDWINKQIDDFEDSVVQLVSETIHDLRYRVELELEKVDPPKRLRGHCPKCKKLATIHVYFKHYEIEKAVCNNCDATWSPDQLGELSSSL